MTKATPVVRSYIHNDNQDKQINNVTKTEKMWGAESNPMYQNSPVKIQSQVLEKRVFKTPSSQQSKKRLQSAKITRGAKQSVSNFGKS